MRFTGANLKRVLDGLRSHRFLVHNDIVTCPDPVEYESLFRALLLEREQTDWLISRVENAVIKEDYVTRKCQS